MFFAPNVLSMSSLEGEYAQFRAQLGGELAKVERLVSAEGQ